MKGIILAGLIFVLLILLLAALLIFVKPREKFRSMLAVFETFFRRHGLELIDIVRNSNKGGSIRGIVQLAGGSRLVSASVVKVIAGYGASTPVTTLLIPILPSQALYERKPDYVVVLAWNYFQPILKNHQAFLDQGGHFIVPLPALVVV